MTILLLDNNDVVIAPNRTLPGTVVPSALLYLFIRIPILSVCERSSRFVTWHAQHCWSVRERKRIVSADWISRCEYR